jgi:hypothetical protein
MVDTCTVTWTARDFQFAVQAETKLDFVPNKRFALVGYADVLYVPTRSVAFSDGAGAGSIALVPGNYVLHVITPDGTATARVAVPNQPTAEIGTCIDQVLTLPTLSDFQVLAAEVGADRVAADASALAADTSADASAASAAAALGAKTAAESARDAGALSASVSATSETNALASKVAAQAAKIAAEAAQAGAETARTEAETAQTGAQTARAAAETAQAGAETARAGSEAAQTGAQSARTGAEYARDDAQAAKTIAEAAKTAAESARDAGALSAAASATSETNALASNVAAQAAKTAAEAAQAGAETARTEAETAQTGAQTARTGAETARDAAQASASASATSAGQSAGSAAQSLAIYGSVEAQQTAVATAQAQASLAAGYAASAASVAQQDLSGVAVQALHRSPNAITALAIYDTSKDSDGGAWTKKCRHTSWWNEALNGKWLGAQASETAARAVSGATTGDYFQRTTDGLFYALNATSGITQVYRGNTRDFPKIAAIVAEASSVTIYDLTQTGRPMWMRFAATATATLSAKQLLAGANALAALNGKILVGGNGTNLTGLTLIDFPRDAAELRQTSGYTWAGGISGRNGTGGYLAVDAAVTGIVNATVNAVAMTVLPDAPLDPVTGLRVPTIAVATGSGLSVIKHDGVVRNSGYTGSVLRVAFADNQYLWSGMAGYNNFTPRTVWEGAGFNLFDSNAYYDAASQFPLKNLNSDGTNRLTRGQNYSIIAGSKGTQLIRRHNDTRKAVAAEITPTYNTGWMAGDIRRCYLSDTDVESAAQTNIWTAGFSASGWSVDGCTVTTDGSSLSLAFTDVNKYAYKSFTTVVGKAYTLDVTLSGAARNVYISTIGVNGSPIGVINAAGRVTKTFIATQTSYTFGVAAYTAAGTVTITALSIGLSAADRSYKTSGALITGTLTKAQLLTGTSLVGYSGFSAANYLREPYSADLDFGTGEWAGSAWMNVPVTLPDSSFPTVGSELVTNGDFSGGMTGWTGAGWSVSGGIASGSPGGAALQGGFTAVPGKVYLVEFTILATNYLSVSIGGASLGVFLSPQTVRRYVFATSATGMTLAAGGAITSQLDNVSVREVGPAIIFDRAASTGPRLRLGVDATGRLAAEAFDGTTTRTATTSASYNTAQWLKARVNYTTDGTLAILVNGREVATTRGTPLLTLNNASAVLTIGNSFALDAPFPGSIALLKLGATVPTPEQSVFMFEQEKQLFRAGALLVLPDSGAIVDMAYDDATDRWVAISAANESYWTGLVRNSVQAVPSGSFSRVVAGSGIELAARITTNPGVDVTIPAYGLREELVRRAEAAARLSRELAVYDFVGGFTANTTSGSTAITSVAGLTYPTSIIGARVSGAGIPANTTIVGVSGTTIYLSAAATATATGVSVSFLDFNLPVGLEAKAVLSAGALRQEGSTKDYTRLFNGFLETIRFAVAPGATAWVQLQATKGAM